MPITLPTAMPDGSTRDLDYYDLNELAGGILPLSRTTIRRRLSTRAWPGTQIGPRWYMTRDDVALAVAGCHHEADVHLPEPGDDDDPEGERQPRLGVVVTDENLDDVRGVR